MCRHYLTEETKLTAQSKTEQSYRLAPKQEDDEVTVYLSHVMLMLIAKRRAY